MILGFLFGKTISIIMQYIVTYKLYIHIFNKEIEDKIAVDNGLSFFDGEMLVTNLSMTFWSIMKC